jgi:hypothetical protein
MQQLETEHFIGRNIFYQSRGVPWERMVKTKIKSS